LRFFVPQSLEATSQCHLLLFLNTPFSPPPTDDDPHPKAPLFHLVLRFPFPSILVRQPCSIFLVAAHLQIHAPLSLAGLASGAKPGVKEVTLFLISPGMARFSCMVLVSSALWRPGLLFLSSIWVEPGDPLSHRPFFLLLLIVTFFFPLVFPLVTFGQDY